MKTWRLLDTGASPGSLNMAIDQAVLSMHARGESPPTLRIYQWSPPAISLGYFQRCHGIDLAACRRLGIDVVRRPTGGRAVLHFEDLTYCVVAGTTDGIPSAVTAAFRLICGGLSAAFRILGFETELGRQGAGSPQSDMCFLTITAGDLLHKGKKFIGSAQTWQGSSMLQHGSIILEPHSEILARLQGGEYGPSATREEMFEDTVTSVREILGRVPGIGEVGAAIRHGMAHALGAEFTKGKLSQREWAMAREIIDQQVEAGLWSARRVPEPQLVSTGSLFSVKRNQ
jgi:lipoate-protein ligase A